jgi:hypothetical protein
MTVRKTFLPVALISMVVLAACDPGGVTEAREQLARGPADTVQYLLPLARDTFDVSDLDLARDTVIDGIVAVVLDEETVRYAIADDLRFENIQLSNLAVSFPPGVFQVPPGTVLDTAVSYAGLVDEPRLQGVDSLRVVTGTLQVVTRNRLVETIAYTVVLDGFRTAAGGPLTTSGTIPAAPGDGSYATDVLVFDLAGVTIAPPTATVTVDASLVVSGSPANAANATDAILQTGTADFTVEWLRGPLDPSVTPELTVDVQDDVEIPESSLDALGNFRDVLADVMLESALGRMVFVNGAAAPVEVTDLILGVVALTATGDVPIDPGTGEPAYETDDQGAPILVPVPGPGGTVQVARNGTTELAVAMPALLDRVVKLLLAGERAAIVGSGTAIAGDGQPSAVNRTDEVVVTVDLVVGVDATIPASGVDYPAQNETNDGLDLQPDDIADVIDNLLVRAFAQAEVVNGTPYELEVAIAYIEGDVGTVDVFTLPGAVILDPVRLAAPEVSADGRVVAPVVDTVEVAVAAAEAEPLLTATYTTTLRTRLFPGPGGGGRAALGADDRAVVRSSVVLEVKRGGAQ